MSVSVASTTLAKIFDHQGIIASDGSTINGQLAIPEYQRPYRWTEEQLLRLLQDFKDYQSDFKSDKDIQKCPLYLGSIILHQQGNLLNIIDGQQRLTTMALIAFLKGEYKDSTLRYEAPESQQQIKHNLAWLSDKREQIATIDFSLVNVTLVVTNNEDEAYRFFETQNTGGVRLKGPDIIKAHHLNVIDKNMPSKTRHYAALWESLNNINPVIDVLLRGRYWEYFNLRKDLKDRSRRTMPLHHQKRLLVDAVVDEFSPKATGEDIAFGRVQRTYFENGGESLSQPQVGYDFRQPLNSGANTIHYLQYFEQLRQTYLVANETENITGTDFHRFYHELVCNLHGCGYLKQLFDASLLLYISQFGQQGLEVAAKKLFRVVYSRRVENQVAVKEKSVPAFLRETPILDWISMSYTPEQCFLKLDAFELNVNAEGIIEAERSPTKQKSSRKQDFINKVKKEFSIEIEIQLTKEQYAAKFSNDFTAKVRLLGGL
ncbi:DUF262 domain-containing protein [Vibrio splendidus]|uniref:DUF262 domain-containing protein n=1 Tax=Vibrio splendidus TaxID=29497 RepID=UPI000C850177|nr:DUF262 domain-containing protein [Vibrio splendidus]PMH69394.1 hypothetical protein BCU61_12930 [Vibrio splendidus]